MPLQSLALDTSLDSATSLTPDLKVHPLRRINENTIPTITQPKRDILIRLIRRSATICIPKTNTLANFIERTKSFSETVYLLAYSEGRLSRRETIRLMDLRDYAELLVRLGMADLPMPQPPPHEVENQAVLFEKLWKSA